MYVALRFPAAAILKETIMTHASSVRRVVLLSLSRVQMLICHALLTLMILAITAQIVGRSIGFSIDVTEEVARFSFIAVVFVAAGYTSMHGDHLAITFALDKAGEGTFLRKLLNTLIFVFTIGFDAVFLYLCIYGLLDGFAWPNVSPVLGMNVAYLYLAPVIGFSCSIVARLLTFAPIQKSTIDDGVHTAEQEAGL